MKILKYCTLLTISTISLCTTPHETSEQFSQCPSTEKFEQMVEILAKQLSQNQETMQKLLSEIETERSEKKALSEKERADKKTLYELKMQKWLKEEEEKEKALEWFKNLPWYSRYSIVITAKTTPWITQQLIPTVQSILTSMVARKIVESGLSGTDFLCGDIPEKIFPNRFGAIISLRPGEWLALSSDQRAKNAMIRKLENSDSEFKQMKKEIEKLEKEISPKIIFNKTEQQLNDLQTQQMLRSHPDYQKYLQELRLLRSETKFYKTKQALATEFAELARNKEKETGFDEFLKTKYSELLINRQKSSIPTPAQEVREEN